MQDRILVRVAEDESTSSGGVILTAQSSEKPNIGEVVAVGPGRKGEDGEWMAPNMSAGSQVPCCSAVPCRMSGPCRFTAVKFGCCAVLLLFSLAAMPLGGRAARRAAVPYLCHSTLLTRLCCVCALSASCACTAVASVAAGAAPFCCRALSLRFHSAAVPMLRLCHVKASPCRGPSCCDARAVITLCSCPGYVLCTAADCAAGPQVLYSKFSGVELEEDDVQYVVVRETDVLAVLS